MNYKFCNFCEQFNIIQILTEHTTHPAIAGKYGKGQTNSNGELLLDIVQKYNLTIANTLFKHKVAHRTTWTCNAKQTLSG